jgi:hypothetical protein
MKNQTKILLIATLTLLTGLITRNIAFILCTKYCSIVVPWIWRGFNSFEFYLNFFGNVTIGLSGFLFLVFLIDVFVNGFIIGETVGV